MEGENLRDPPTAVYLIAVILFVCSETRRSRGSGNQLLDHLLSFFLDESPKHEFGKRIVVGRPSGLVVEIPCFQRQGE